jgi:transposase
VVCHDLLCGVACASRTFYGQETGIDLGLESFATLANGQTICTPNYYRKAEVYLRRPQRRVARRKKGGNWRRGAVARLPPPDSADSGAPI